MNNSYSTVQKLKSVRYSLLLLLFVFSMLLPKTGAAWIENGNLELPNQTALDNLETGLTEVKGSVTIGSEQSNDINDISKLESLKTIGWDLKIWSTNLTNFSSLSCVESITGSFIIIGNASLTTIGNMTALKSINDSFVLSNNISLKNLDTLQKLTTISNYLMILRNPVLENIDGFKSLTSAGEITVSDNEKLQNLDGFSKIAQRFGFMTILKNETLAEFCGLYPSLRMSPEIFLQISGNAENPNREQILYDCGPNTINVTVWHDKNENGTVDPDEKGLPDVTLRLSLEDQVVKHSTNSHGSAFFDALPDGEKTICVDMSSLPSGITCTTGETCDSKLVDEDHHIVAMQFGFSGEGLDELSQDYVVEQIDEYIQPDKLFFVSGSPVYESSKFDYGWDNLVDESVDPDTGSTWAAVEADAAEKPFGIFEFGDKGLYKFNYVQFQTGNGENSKLAYQAQKIKVMVSTTGTADEDFASIGEFNCTYGVDKMQWCKLADYATAKYIKVCLLSPTVPGKYVQIVEFDVDSDDKSGPISTTLPAAQQENIVEIPDSQPLLSNYPNPFNPTTNIVYQVNNENRVSVKIFDLTGKQVAELVNAVLPIGEHSITWNAGDMPSGVYFMCMQAGTQKATKRILLMK